MRFYNHFKTQIQQKHNSTPLSRVEFNVPLNTLQVISKTMFTANHLTGARHQKLDITSTNKNAKKT